MKTSLFFSKFSFKNLKTLHFRSFLPKSCKFHSLEITTLCTSEKKTFPTLTMSASTHGNEGTEYPNKRARAAPVLAPDSRRTEPAAPVGFVEVVRIETLEREVQTLEREVQTLEREVQTLEREVRALRTAAEVKSDNDDDESDLARSTRRSKLKNEVALNKLKLYVQSHITAKTMADKMYPLKLWDSAIDMVTLGTERVLPDKWPNNFVVSADLSELVRVAMEDGNKENILANNAIQFPVFHYGPQEDGTTSEEYGNKMSFVSYLFIAYSVSDLAFAAVQNPKKFLGISEGEEELDYDMYDVESELHRWSNIFHELEKYMLREDNQLDLVVAEAHDHADFFVSDDFFYTNMAGNVQSYLDESVEAEEAEEAE